jgi:hypothetical protein
MDAQLRLLTAPVTTAARHDPVDAPTDEAPPLEPGPVMWRLSDRTRDLGRRGIAEARDRLHRARPSTADRDHDRADHRHEPTAA